MVVDERIKKAEENRERHAEPRKPVMAFFAIGALLTFFGGGALHIWTTCLFWGHWGAIWGIACFFFPFLAEFVACIVCFGWGLWFYILGVAGILGGFLVLDSMQREQGKQVIVWGWIAVLSVGAFSCLAVRHAIKRIPTELTAAQLKEADDAAMAVCSVLNASMAMWDDPAETTRLVETKADLRNTLAKYDKEMLGAIRRRADSYLRVLSMFFEDFRNHLNGPQGTDFSGFHFEQATRDAIKTLSPAIQACFTDEAIGDLERRIPKVFEDLRSGPVPEQPMEAWNEMMRKKWRAMAAAYSDLLGKPIPKSPWLPSEGS